MIIYNEFQLKQSSRSQPLGVSSAENVLGSARGATDGPFQGYGEGAEETSDAQSETSVGCRSETTSAGELRYHANGRINHHT